MAEMEGEVCKGYERTIYLRTMEEFNNGFHVDQIIAKVQDYCYVNTIVISPKENMWVEDRVLDKLKKVDVLYVKISQGNYRLQTTDLGLFQNVKEIGTFTVNGLREDNVTLKSFNGMTSLESVGDLEIIDINLNDNNSNNLIRLNRFHTNNQDIVMGKINIYWNAAICQSEVDKLCADNSAATCEKIDGNADC